MKARTRAWITGVVLACAGAGVGCASDGPRELFDRGPAMPGTEAAQAALSFVQNTFIVIPNDGGAKRGPVPKAHSHPALASPEISSFHADSNFFEPRMPPADMRSGLPSAEVSLGVRADRQMHLRELATGVGVHVALEGASSVPGQVANGYIVYPGALQGADVIHRVLRSGTEDYVAFHGAPPSREVRYTIRLDEGVAGLRLVGNSLELLDAEGAPRVRMAAPYVVDHSGRYHSASAAVEGCAVDTSPAAPWHRAVTDPGRRSCTVIVRWGEDITYPALLDPAWTTTGGMATARQAFASAVMSNGRVLVAGGNVALSGVSIAAAEVFDPNSGTWAATASMPSEHSYAAAAILSNTSILVAAGYDNSVAGYSAAAHVYNSGTGTWSTTASVTRARGEHTANVLASGKVLVAGGLSVAGIESSTEIYDPVAGTWSAGPSLVTGRYGHVAVVLNNGKLLAAGGGTATTANLASAETYDPSAGAWASAGSMAAPRYYATASLLSNGNVLVAGGQGTAALQTAELYNSASGWSTTGSMSAARYMHSATAISNGRILVTGGSDGVSALTSAETYSVAKGTWSAAASMSTGSVLHAGIALNDGRALIAGGATATNATLSRGELALPADVSTSQSTYAYPATITVNYGNMFGASTDFVSIEPAGSAPTTELRYAYTSGAVSGSASFSGVLPGTYVARAYFSNGSLIEGESASFTITGSAPTTVTTDKASYATTDNIVVTYANMPGYNTDFVTIEPSGSPAGSTVKYAYLNGSQNGSKTFSNVPAGSYVARAYFNNGNAIKAQSPVFTVGVAGATTVTTNAATYAYPASVVVTYSNMPGYTRDYVTIAPAGSSASTELRYAYTNGVANGTATFSGILPGTYVARAYYNDGSTVQAESASFTITGTPDTAVSTDKASYLTTDTITVSFAHMAGYYRDYVTISAAGSPATSFVTYSYTQAGLSGTRSFTGIAAGTYVARAYFNDGTTIQAASATFTVGP